MVDSGDSKSPGDFLRVGSNPTSGISYNHKYKGGSMAEKEEERKWDEEFEVDASELVETVKELIREGNIRRIIIRNKEDEILLEIPLTAGVVVGSVVAAFSPVLAAVGALAALLAKVKVQVVKEKEEETVEEEAE